jgi:hypothetical protein
LSSELRKEQESERAGDQLTGIGVSFFTEAVVAGAHRLIEASLTALGQ